MSNQPSVDVLNCEVASGRWAVYDVWATLGHDQEVWIEGVLVKDVPIVWVDFDAGTYGFYEEGKPHTFKNILIKEGRVEVRRVAPTA